MGKTPKIAIVLMLLSPFMPFCHVEGQVPDPLAISASNPEAPKLVLRHVQLFRYSPDMHRYFLELRGRAERKENTRWIDVTLQVMVSLNNGSKVSFDGGTNFSPDESQTEVYASPITLLGGSQPDNFQPSDIKSLASSSDGWRLSEHANGSGIRWRGGYGSSVL